MEGTPTDVQVAPTDPTTMEAVDARAALMALTTTEEVDAQAVPMALTTTEAVDAQAVPMALTTTEEVDAQAVPTDLTTMAAVDVPVVHAREIAKILAPKLAQMNVKDKQGLHAVHARLLATNLVLTYATVRATRSA